MKIELPPESGTWNIGFRWCAENMTSRNGFVWPRVGWCEAPGPLLGHREDCPRDEGDGVCVALTASGASSGRLLVRHILTVLWTDEDVLGESADKARVKRAWVAGVVDLLSGADLSGANLSGAKLSGADLYGANLSWANLSGANLSGANLYGANLYGANLSWANLYGANLSWANLSGANLSGANLYGANLSEANLSEAIGRSDWNDLMARGGLR